MAIPKDMNEQPSILDEQPTTTQPVPEEELVQVAGVTSAISRKATKGILEPLTAKGARVSPESKITRTPTLKESIIDAPFEPSFEIPKAEVPQPQPVKPAPVDQAEVDARLAAREQELGAPREVPSPSKAQKEQGLVKGPVNTRFYDNDGLAATVQAAAKAADAGEVAASKPVTIKEIYDRAENAGIPKENLDLVFSGQDISSSVGGNELAQRMAGLMVLHDVSAGKVDDLMRMAGRGELDDAGKLELREAMAQHNMILDQLSGAKTDVARAMNVFKGARDRGDGLSIKEVRDALDNLGGDDQLRLLAETYNNTNSPAARNALLKNSVSRKSYEAIVYMAQSVMLNDPTTHMYNAAGNALNLFMDVPERALSVPIGMLRQRLAKTFGYKTDPDRYYGADLYARVSGFRNGMIDGWSMMGEKLLEGGAAKDAPTDPLTTKFWAGANYKIPFTKQVREFPDLSDNVLGKVLNSMGLVYSVPFRALGAADEFFAGTAQRMQLHEEAARLGGRIYDTTLQEMIDAGAEPKTAAAQAMSIAQRAVQKLLTERPADIEMSINAWRKQVTLQDDLNREAPFSGIYSGASKLMNKWYVKPLVPFSKTLTNIAIESSARAGPLAFVSPRFYSEMQKGGKGKDLAISRLTLGGSMLYAGYIMAGDGTTTGAGPADTDQRRALQSRGWQPFSFVIGKDQITSENVQQLRDILGAENVTEGTGQDFDGNIYISMKRLEPANMPLLLGAAYADAMRYHEYDEDGSFQQAAFDASVAALAEYSTSIPAMQTFAKVMRIANQRQTDGGDRLVAMFNQISQQYGSFLISGTPILGFTNSTLTSRIERAIDPAVSNVGVGEDFPDALVGLGEAYNRWRSRIPVYSKDVPIKLDDYGDPIGMTNAPAWQPLSMTFGEHDETKEFLDAIHHAIPPAQRKFEGVKIPPEIEARYKTLYAKEITIDGMTMKENINAAMSEMMDDAEFSGTELAIGDMRSMVNNIVGQYRKIAQIRMFGARSENEADPRLFEYAMVPEDLSEYGLFGEEIEFPEFAEKLAAKKNKRRFPKLTAPKGTEKPSLSGMIK